MAEAPRFFLIVEAPNGDVRETPLGRAGLVIGRDESADIRVDDKKVSRRHATFKLVDGDPWVEDLGSSNGVRVNGKKINRRQKVTYGDKVRVGGFYMWLKEEVSGSAASLPQMSKPVRVVERSRKVPVEEVPRLVGAGNPVSGKTFTLQRGESIIGRLEECDIPILDGSVSRQHARVVYARDRVTLTDLGSANGVFVNKLRIDVAELADRDEIVVGKVPFVVHLPPELARKASVPLRQRAKRKSDGGRRNRWLIIGAAGLFLAAFVVTGAVYYRIKNPPTTAKKQAGSPLAGVVDSVDAGPAPVSLDAATPVATNTRPPPVAPPPQKAPPVAPPKAPPVVKAPPKAPPVAQAPPKAPPVVKAPPKAPPVAPPPLLTAAVGTATSPTSRRTPEGLPINLPSIDPSFDFDGFVASQLERAKTCETTRDYACLKKVLGELLEKDPINPEGRKLLKKSEMYAAAAQALLTAARLEKKGELAEAYQALSEIPDDVPQAEEAKKQAKRLRSAAIDDELERASELSRSRKTYNKAHSGYLRVLALESTNREALTGLRKLEAKMRKRKIRFAAYVPPDVSDKPRSLDEMGKAIVQHFSGSRSLAAVGQAYARGDLKKAKSRAARAAKKGSRVEKRRARKLSAALSDLDRTYRRTRTEVSNDPERAWSMLIELERKERALLPAGVKSFLVRELEVRLSEGFAERGASMRDRGRFEDAFQAWVAGYKLDATNPKVLAGLEQLETQAERLAQEAELAAQRGASDVCDRYKRITRMTRASTEVHKKARQQAFAVCG